MLVRPHRNFIDLRRGIQKPLWPFTLNRDSWQARGLVGWWPFSPAGGGTLYDMSGNHNHGTLTNGPVWVSSRFGSALSFDDVDDVVVIANESNFDFERTDPFSIVAWIKTGTTDRDSIVSKIMNANPFTGLNFEAHDTGELMIEIINVNSPSNKIVKLSASAVNDNKWHHVGVTYDGSSAESGVNLYIDGNLSNGVVEHNTLTASILNDINLRIGNFSTGGLAPYGGLIDETRIYSRKLSATEMAALREDNISGKWNLYYPLRRRIYVSMPVGAGGNEGAAMYHHLRNLGVYS